MPLLLFIAFIIVPLIELAIIIRVGQEIGLFPTIAVLIAVSVLGTYLMTREGASTWRRLRETLRSGKMPTQEVMDGFLILTGGALLLTPGFLTDVFGLTLLFPPTRAGVKRSLRGVFARWAGRRGGLLGNVGRGVYEARVVRDEPTAREPRPPEATPLSPRDPDGEDGSPGTG